MYFILKTYLQRLVKHFRRTSSAQSLKEILNESVVHGVKCNQDTKAIVGKVFDTPRHGKVGKCKPLDHKMQKFNAQKTRKYQVYIGCFFCSFVPYLLE
jgi:hypothetical protein